MHIDILGQIGIAIVAATLFAIAAKHLRQPVVLGYMAAGVVIGPTEGFGWISTHDIEPISELGLILLLFMIGLEIDLKKLRQAGVPVVAAGIGQFLICVALGLGLAPLIGFHSGGATYSPIYYAVAVALSSTMIVVKLLYDKFELDSLPGRITLGVLVFQDIWAILFLAVQPNLAHPTALVLALSLAKGVGLIACALLMSRFVLPVVFRSIAKLPEVMLIGALAWCFGVSMLASWLGLSREMGALIAGVSISTFPYNLDVIAKAISLRDFFITLFFVTLGAQIPRPTGEMLLLALATALFLTASRFLSITPILWSLKLGNRASFIPALNLSQLSEFSLVICSLGVGLGHIPESLLSLMVVTLVITSLTSTYGILFNHEIFERVNPLLVRLGMRDLSHEGEEAHEVPARPIVLLGFSLDASSLLHELLLKDAGLAGKLAVVDFNPDVKKELDRRGIANVYGDIGHSDTLHHANIADARVLVSTIPDPFLKGTSNLRLLRQLQRLAPDALKIVTAHRLPVAEELYAEGASFVYVPRLMSVRELRDVVLTALHRDLEDERREAKEELLTRAEVLP
ncbi:MAG: cation:proton antiporter [Candidatus Koribacter versatilis]|uniref:Cation:proton antiporter n=1 Tax=Candidatus Korobacter versatilis TaxID=658062 RepID=A0A932A5X7_9BACT|nr:cation:proton antiporter [Candidatus Koribacter versatilis]